MKQWKTTFEFFVLIVLCRHYCTTPAISHSATLVTLRVQFIFFIKV